MDFSQLRQTYHALLTQGIVPFWMTRGLDTTHGGVLSCMTEDGTPISTDKYIWSQARFLWVISALYNYIEPRPEFLEAAHATARFLLAHGRDAENRWIYRTSREGAPLEGPISIFADCFAVYGFTEYFRATGDPDALATARQTHADIVRRIAEPAFHDTAPYAYPPNIRIHSISMMLTEITNRLAAASPTPDPELEALTRRHAYRILDKFLRPERRALVEMLDTSYQPIAAPAGTYVVPGHAIESMWFILDWARRVNDTQAIARAVEAIRWHLELGWDSEFGGLLLATDLEGNPPFFPNADKKVWWPHTEALYALLLAHHLTGEPWCLEWYQRIHDYSFQHFSMPETGEWRQRLDRQGRPIEELIALPVKDPFHLPRAVIFILDLLKTM